MKASFVLVALLATAGLARAQQPSVQVRTDKSSDPNLRLEWDLSWIEVQGVADRAVQQRVNQALARVVTAEKELMQREALQYLQSMTDDTPDDGTGWHTLFAGMHVGLLTRDTLSLSFHVSSKLITASNPHSRVRTVTFDLRSGERVPEKDLFQARPDVRAELARRVDEKLKADPDYRDGDTPMLQDVEASDIKAVHLEPGGMRFIFGGGELGPSVGAPSARLSWDEVGDLVSSTGLMSRVRPAPAPSAGIVGRLHATR